MKTTEQREKDLKDGVTWIVASAWSKAISGFEKDLKAPVFVKSGDVAAFASQYDALQSSFNKQIGKRNAAMGGGVNDLIKQTAKRNTERSDLKKELGDVATDAGKSLDPNSWDERPESVIAELETNFVAMQDMHKEEKAIFDRWMKLSANFERGMAEVIAKAKKDHGGANAALKATNDQLNALEKRMRDTVAAYANTATSMNRQDIASAVRGFLAIFAKA